MQFLLIGDGGERAKLERLAQGLANVTFVDPLSDKDYGMALRAADVLLVNEKPGVCGMAVPSKLTSYFDAGRAVVAATDEKGITASELSTAGAGIVVPAGVPEALLQAVVSVASDKALADRLGANGRNFRLRVLGQESAIDSWTRVIEAVSSTTAKANT